MVNVQLRPLQPDSDFPRIAELSNLIDEEEIDVDRLYERLHNASAERIQQYTVAIDADADGMLVGFSNTIRDPWMPEGHFWTRAIVDPAQQHQGIGSMLFDHALAFVREQNATHADSEVRDNCVDCLRFAERRGFQIERHLFESRLDLTTFDESRSAGTVEAVEASGIRFFTLADVGNTPENQQKLYEFNRACAADNPSNEGWSFPSFEDFRKRVFLASWFRADGQILAADGERWVGIAAVGVYEQTNGAHNAFTGVDRAYRGRKIALALKLLAIRYALGYGADNFQTLNDSTNEPMLTINRKLGYQSEPGIYVLVRRLSS
jgi:GNAT superfamily N-acetyltransferase